MGPRFFKRGELSRYYNALAYSRRLQWGHASSSVESGSPSNSVERTSLASMGPRFFKRGEHGGYQRDDHDREASMGPRFFKRGEIVARVSHEIAYFVLQWGHASSSVESQPRLRPG